MTHFQVCDRWYGYRPHKYAQTLFIPHRQVNKYYKHADGIKLHLTCFMHYKTLCPQIYD